MKNSKIVSLSFLALSAFLLPGCKSGSNDAAVRTAWQTGDVATASLKLQESASPEKLEDAADPVLRILDAGLVAGVNGEYEQSD